MADRDDSPSERTPDAPPEDVSNGPMVVGIGASAGGLNALQSFFAHVPEQSGLAYVVVVHLNPEHESHLAELLQSHLHMPVQQVTENIELKPDQVYVIPPGFNLDSVDTHLRPSRLEKQRELRAPIDHFFRTLAATHDGHAVGVILSGTGSDGTLGVKAIKERDGFVLVQDPLEAEYDGMPRSAIATGLVDQVLPLAEIPQAILRFATTAPRVELPEEGEDLHGDQRMLLQKIFAQLRARTSRDFNHYKRSTLLRRIQRRMQLRQVEELSAYVELLRKDGDEVRALADDILITVTNFFRDPETWHQLQAEIVPALFDARGPSETVRVWSVGCATGEEAYSLAILLMEEAARRDGAPHVQVFASDLHERSLERAREGFYPGDIETDVNPERLRRFFHKEDGGYRVKKEVREHVVFAPHNLLGDPPFSRLDLVSCRNVLIYLQRDVQRDIVELFHYALRPDGVLVLGSSENVEASELFRVEDKHHRIFRKRNVRAPEPRLPVFPMTRVRLPGDSRPAETTALPLAYGAMHQKLVEKYAPPSMLIGPDGKVVHLSEHAGRYLVVPGGEPTTTAFKLVREELRVELRAALHTARESSRPTRSKPIMVRFNGERAPVVLDVRPALEPAHEGFVLVIFEEQPPAAGEALAHAVEAAGDGAGEDARLAALEAEIDEYRQRMQAIVEEYETSQEEMKASAEELQSANEELRSTLEELETSKEELQSMNEELQTVNQENRHKVEELSQLSSDLQNLLASTDIATLFLDRELRILRFTPKVGELFNVRPVDRGRPLSDLTHRLGYPQLEEDALAVLRTLIPIEREVDDRTGHCYLTRVLPYRSGEDRIEGVVMTLLDITGRKESEKALQESEERFRAVANLVPDLLWQNDAQGRVLWYNDRWYAYTGQTPPDALGEGWTAVLHPDDVETSRQEYFDAVRAGQPYQQEYRIRGSDGSYRWFLVRGEPYHLAGHDQLQWFGGAVDIQDQRTALDELERHVAERTAELARANDDLAGQVAERERAQADRNEIMRQLATAEEDERRRIARELHDELGQQVTGLLLGLRAAQQQTNAPELEQKLAELERSADTLSRDLQHLALELRPAALDNLGLKDALQAQLAEWGERHAIECDFHARGLGHTSLPPEVETTLYRAMQEGLTNVLKHAGASHVSLVLERRGGAVSAILEDNGQGFDVEKVLSSPDMARRLGLRGMRERVALLGGELEIESSPGKGTTLFVRLREGAATRLGADQP